jgi:GDPmannose 4,6-dehydratase
VNAAAKELGMMIEWRGKGLKEVGVIGRIEGGDKTGPKKSQTVVRVDPRYFRPTEVETLLGDATKARKKLGWKPKIKFKELVAEMVREDLKAAERDELVKRHGYSAYDYHE